MDPEKAFQETWPCCRNGHHFTVQHLRPSVEASVRMARLKTVSGGLLWSVKPERGGKKEELFQTFHFLQHFIKSPAEQEAKQVLFDHYLVKWRLDSWTSISLLLKSLSSLRMAACSG